MAHAKVSVDISHDCGTVVPVSWGSNTVCRILAMLPVDEVLQAVAEIEASDIDAAVETLCRHRSVTASETLHQSPTSAVLKVTMEWPVFYSIARDCGTPIVPPVVFRDETATFEIREMGAKLTELIEELEDENCSPSIEWIHDHTEPHRLLSMHQREIVTTAIELGYYESPRNCTLTELSEHLGIAKSTCSDRLRRAEEAIIRWHIDHSDGTVTRDERTLGSTVNTISNRSDVDAADAQKVDSSTYRCDQNSDSENIFELLANQNVRSLFCNANEPKTTQELADECNLSRSTAYRLTDELEQADLLVPLTEREETNSVRYHRAVQRALIRIGDTVSVSCEPFVVTDRPS